MRLKTKSARLSEAMSRIAWASLDPVAALVGRDVEGRDLAADAAHADDRDWPVGVALLRAEGGLDDARHLLGDLDDDRGGVDEAVPDEAGRLGDRGADEAPGPV